MTLGESWRPDIDLGTEYSWFLSSHVLASCCSHTILIWEQVRLGKEHEHEHEHGVEPKDEVLGCGVVL